MRGGSVDDILVRLADSGGEETPAAVVRHMPCGECGRPYVENVVGMFQHHLRYGHPGVYSPRHAAGLTPGRWAGSAAPVRRR